MLRTLLLALAIAVGCVSVAEAQCVGAGGIPFNCQPGSTPPGAADLFMGGSALGSNTVKWTGLQAAQGLFGQVPALSGGGMTNFLRADGTWDVPAGAIQVPAIIQAGQNPTAFRDALSVRDSAPRRNLLTVGMSYFDPVYSTSNSGANYTYLAIMPLEAQPYAVRIAVSQPWAGAWQIASAAVYMSDSYSGFTPGGGAIVAGNDNNNRTIIPTAHSVYQTCTFTNSSAVVTCPNTTTFPTASTMYVLGVLGVPVSGTATVTNGTTITLSGAFTGTTGAYPAQFANIATECKLYYDNQGASIDTLPTTPNAGINRGITINGNPANVTTSTVYSAPPIWSDFQLCNGMARADGGSQYLAFVYMTNGPNTTSHSRNAGLYSSSGLASGWPGNAAAGYNQTIGGPILGGRYVITARPWANGGTDWADNMAGTGWTMFGATQTPNMALQYVTDARGWQIMTTGDSISASPPQDPMGNPVNRACKLLSTPQAPCEWFSVAYGGGNTAIYTESFRNFVPAVKPSAVIIQPLSRNDGVNLSNYQMIFAKGLSYASAIEARLGVYGAFPFTTTIDASTSQQADYMTMRARLLALGQNCQPNTGGLTCPHIPVLDPTSIISRAALGGNAWDYLGLGFFASGAASAGATTIPVATGSTAPCYPGDILTDLTTAGVVKVGATVTSSTGTVLTVPSDTVIGTGIAANDNLVCSMPGWSGGALSYDNTHPWDPAMLLLQPAATTFVKQLLGMQ